MPTLAATSGNPGTEATFTLNGSGFVEGASTITISGGATIDTSLVGITTSAVKGTPAQGGVASANPGQTITLQGDGLLANDQIVFTVQYGNGYATTAAAAPAAVAADGTSLTVMVPDAAITGAVRLQREGAGLMLQVVPVLIGVSANPNQSIYDSYLTLTGRGFVDGASLITFGAQDLADISHSGGANVGATTVEGKYTQNGYMAVAMPDGAPLGPLSITTADGTSAPFALNEMTLPYGTLRDVALDPATGALWMSGDSPLTGRIRRIDPATSLEQQFFDLTAADFGSTAFYAGGMQVTTEAFTLNATTVPAGSLLIFNAYASADVVTAVNQATGAVIASLNLGVNYDLTSGVYDPTTNHIFITDRRAHPHRRDQPSHRRRDLNLRRPVQRRRKRPGHRPGHRLSKAGLRQAPGPYNLRVQGAWPPGGSGQRPAYPASACVRTNRA